VAALARRAALVAAALLGFTAAPAHAWDEARYWAFADRVQERVDDAWSKSLDRYTPHSISAETMMNANMLLVHATAALRGYHGPSRQDARARSIATQLVTQTPPWLEIVRDPQPGSQPHAPGWTASMREERSGQHLVVDGEVADALATAWRARDAIGLDPNVAAVIQDRLRRVAESPYWRYPTIRLNQINWYAEVYSAAAEVTGDPAFLQRDMHGQLTRFVRSIRKPTPGTAGTLGPGMRFHYLPDGAPRSQLNTESAEYANIVASTNRFYDAAVARGMPPLPPADEALLRRWMTRVLAGYWTHAGYLNWDTGFSFGRWHQMKKLGLAQQSLIGIAAGGRLSPSRAEAAWAKYILESGFALYERKLPEHTGVAPGLFYPFTVHPQSDAQALLSASRLVANAARAVSAGIAARPVAEPPPLYAFDPDVGRLAITTPRYNTAITAVTQGAYPYGGIDIARLYDDRQEVAATLGAQAPASFGLLVRDRRGNSRLVTARPASDRTTPPALRLVRAPRGVGSAGTPLRPFAGRFRVLRVTGTAHGAGVDARSTYTFRRSSIFGEWAVHARTTARRSAEALFPSTGGDRAAVWAILRSGLVVKLEDRIEVRGVAAFWVESEHAGYVVVPSDRVKGSVATIIQPKTQPSAPDPGPTLSIRLTNRLRKRTVHFSARIEPARDLDAARLAAR
jgi:hypothetical protein